jgi:hypothetical protein
MVVPLMVEQKMRVWLPLIVLLPLMAMACRDFEDRTGSSGLVNGPEVNAGGTWSGNWTTQVGSGDSGEVHFILQQDKDNNVFGCSCWTGSPCWDNGGYSGIVNGSSILPVVMEVLRDPPGVSPRLGVIRVTGKLDVVGDLMTGTFDVVSADPRRCDDQIARAGDQGTLDVNRNLGSVDVDFVCAEMQAAANCIDELP